METPPKMIWTEAERVQTVLGLPPAGPAQSVARAGVASQIKNMRAKGNL